MSECSKKSLSWRRGCVHGEYVAGGAVCMECVTRSARLAGCLHASSPGSVDFSCSRFCSEFCYRSSCPCCGICPGSVPCSGAEPAGIARVLPRRDGVGPTKKQTQVTDILQYRQVNTARNHCPGGGAVYTECMSQEELCAWSA